MRKFCKFNKLSKTQCTHRTQILSFSSKEIPKKDLWFFRCSLFEIFDLLNCFLRGWVVKKFLTHEIWFDFLFHIDYKWGLKKIQEFLFLSSARLSSFEISSKILILYQFLSWLVLSRKFSNLIQKYDLWSYKFYWFDSKIDIEIRKKILFLIGWLNNPRQENHYSVRFDWGVKNSIRRIMRQISNRSRGTNSSISESISL